MTSNQSPTLRMPVFEQLCRREVTFPRRVYPQSELGLLLLADRTNGHVYATVLRPSVVCLYGTFCG